MVEATLELGAILEAAERAAAAEDFVSAEQYLRQAAALQERQLGAAHPDLANTLNNLGIVSEYLGKPADAETCYRGAYRIAAAALPADHPLVQTSGQNLRDFCEAAGKPFELRETIPPELEPFAPEPTASRPPPTHAPAPAHPAATPAPPVTRLSTPPAASVPATLAPPTQASPKQAPSKPAPSKPTLIAKPPLAPAPPPAMLDLPLRLPEDRPLETPGRKTTTAIRTASPVSTSSSHTGALVFGTVLLLALAVWWFGLREPPQSTAPALSTTETPAPRRDTTTTRDAPAPSVANAAPALPSTQAPAESAPLAEVPARPTTADAGAAPASEPTPPRTERVASGEVSVADAKLCRSLSTSNWVCAPATSPTSPGVFFYYTRVRSPRNTTVQHRWYRDGRLLRTVSLRIGANPGAGYRTYSRNTVRAERSGNWSIELRDAGGALLHEERFTVR